MDDEKSWYRSKTIWGGLVALGAALAGLWGVEIGGTESDALALALSQAGAAVGALVAILGRLAAEKTIR